MYKRALDAELADVGAAPLRTTLGPDHTSCLQPPVHTPPDTTAPIEIKWDEVLGEGKANGLLFVSVEADPKEGMESPFQKKKATQVYMQLTLSLIHI